MKVDIQKGLTPIRKNWIYERDDIEEYIGRDVQPEDNGFLSAKDPRATEPVYPQADRKIIRAKTGKNVTQILYERKGIITAVMEFLVIRTYVEQDILDE